MKKYEELFTGSITAANSFALNPVKSSSAIGKSNTTMRYTLFM